MGAEWTGREHVINREHVARMRRFIAELREGVMQKCVIEGCGRPTNRAYYGLCLLKHYPEARKLVDEGQTTWEELIAQGLAVPKDPAGGTVAGALRQRRAQ